MTDLNVRTRSEEAKRFITDLVGPVLDIGPPNAFSEELRRHYSLADEMDNTLECDFNASVRAPRPVYGTIFCFEVLEHLMNPQLFMQSLNKLLVEGGVVYLSTPLAAVVSVYVTQYHFTEYKRRQLRILFETAGFRVDTESVFTPFPWYFAFHGVRPIIRLMLHKVQMYKLVKMKYVKCEECGGLMTWEERIGWVCSSCGNFIRLVKDEQPE